MALKYPRGTVLLASQVPDQNGVNPKDCFVVLVRDFDDTDALAYGVAVTGTFTLPLRPRPSACPSTDKAAARRGLPRTALPIARGWLWPPRKTS